MYQKNSLKKALPSIPTADVVGIDGTFGTESIKIRDFRNRMQ